MSFEVKNGLMQMVQNDAVSYGIASAFVGDSQDKLTVFTQALNEQSQGSTQESRAAAATEVAKARWAIMYPEVLIA
jgi:hypothetical protein